MTPTIEIKILDNRLHEWGLPKYQTPLAAAIDLYACLDEPLHIQPQDTAVLIPSGMALHMDTLDFCALILPRSGLGHKKGLVLGNSVGLIDADYTAQCFISVWNRNPASSNAVITIQPGERIAQMMFVPVARPAFKVVETFSAASQRGSGGFGSTGV
jgi:dUTP pyrophosphatase